MATATPELCGGGLCRDPWPPALRLRIGRSQHPQKEAILVIPSSVEGSRHVSLKLSQRDPSSSLRFAQDDGELLRAIGILAGGFISTCAKTTAADIGNCRCRCCGHRASSVAGRNRQRRRNCRAESSRRYNWLRVARFCRAHPVRHRKLRKDMRGAVAQDRDTIRCRRSIESPTRYRFAECLSAPKACDTDFSRMPLSWANSGAATSKSPFV